MNYESIMLKNAIRMKKSANLLVREMRLVAMRSYDTTLWRNGTMGQVAALSELSQRADLLNMFYESVKKALLLIPARYRALLVAVYFKHRDKQEIAMRYATSVSTVYRKLFAARNSFRLALQSIGCTEQWFRENYSEFDWVLRKENKL